MATDLLRVQANERVDLDDFAFVGQRSIEDNTRHVMTHMLCDPDGQQAWVLSGFTMSPSGVTLQVDRGVAILSRRDGARIVEGLLTSEGEASKTLDLGSFPAGAHGIYVQFVYQDADTQGRTFWNPSTEKEYSQSMAVRKQAAWDVRVETTSPGAEWFKIGEIDPSTMIITDQRPMYFEGVVSDTYATTWGAGNDRNADRQQYGITNLQTFVEAFRTIVEEFRSVSGNRRWWEAGIRDQTIENGLRVGFTGNPATTDIVEIGDSDTFLINQAGFGLRVGFDASDWLDFVRGTPNAVRLTLGGGTQWETQTDLGSYFKFGLRVGIGLPSAQRFEVEDADFYLDLVSGNPEIGFDAGPDDYLTYDRTANALQLWVGGAKSWEFKATYLQGAIGNFTTGLAVGYSDVAPTAGRLNVGDTGNFLELSGSDPRWVPEGGAHLQYTRASDLWTFRAASFDRVTVGLGTDDSAFGELQLRGPSGVMKRLDGEDFEVLRGLAQLTDNEAGNFVLWGCAAYYDDGSPENLNTVAGVGYVGGELLSFAAVSANTRTAGNWLGGASVDVTRWVFAFLRKDGALRFSVECPQDGRLNDNETPEGGYTKYDYLFVGSAQFVASALAVVPFIRTGPNVYLHEGRLGLHASALWSFNSDLLSGTAQITQSATVSEYIPTAANWPYTPAIATILKLRMDFYDIVSVNDYLQIQHGNGVAGDVHKLYLTGLSVNTVNAESTPQEIGLHRATTTLNVAKMSWDAVTSGGAGTRDLSAIMMGYVEPLNRMHGPVFKP